MNEVYCSLCGKVIGTAVSWEDMMKVPRDEHVCEPDASQALRQIFGILFEQDSLTKQSMTDKMERVYKVVESWKDGH